MSPVGSCQAGPSRVAVAADVVDSEDDPTLADALAARASPPDGVVVVRPVPGVRELNHLAADLLSGPGKRFDALSREKQSGRAWVLATLWLQAEGTRHEVVVDADRLPSAAWLAMRAVARTTPAHVQRRRNHRSGLRCRRPGAGRPRGRSRRRFGPRPRQVRSR